MDDKQKQVDEMISVARQFIDDLLMKRKTGDYLVTINISINNGGIRNAYFEPKAREKIV